jgi:regulator of PEP synthase PpsR (kinase-PPPase family)
VSPKKTGRKGGPPPVYVVSGGTGASGLQIVETVLVQFPTLRVPVIVRNHIRSRKQAEAAVADARADGATVVHTFVDGTLRDAVNQSAARGRVAAIDLMGPLIERVEEQSGATPLGQAGLYRRLRKDYFDRVAAIEFAVSHDDGKRPEEISSADIVVIGPSRCGKTPLCMYLAVHGWKAANVPIVRDIPLPGELFRTDRRRVIGLAIDPHRLLEYRRKREERLGKAGMSDYARPSSVLEELEVARKIYRDGGFQVVEVTDKPIEFTADEIVKFIERSLEIPQRQPLPY